MARGLHIETTMNATQKMARNVKVGDKLHGMIVTAVVASRNDAIIEICRGGQWVRFTAYACLTMR